MDPKAADWNFAKKELAPLLNAHEEARLPWILSVIDRYFGRKVNVLDMSARAGFLPARLAHLGHSVTVCDSNEADLEVAKKEDKTGSVFFHLGDPTQLPFSPKSFDIVFAMHLLHRSPEPTRIVQEASRLLIHRGLFIFHTFNRTPLSYLLYVKGSRWLVRDTPKEWNPYALFLKPNELAAFCEKNFLFIKKYYGLRPEIDFRSFLKLIRTRQLPQDFRYVLTSSLLSCYGGVAVKEDMRVKSLNSYADQGLFFEESWSRG